MKLFVFSPSKPFPLYEAVVILRCLSLKRTDPDKYSSIFQLEAHNEERKKTGRLEFYYFEINFASNVDNVDFT
jgi:hypothetical protein